MGWSPKTEVVSLVAIREETDSTLGQEGTGTPNSP